ncbi:galectin-7-like [Engraulis encrasicolus]|uniref:galectin-7-like n=1 Tax=Engraulis encrasicolus TaxID=184585 RepID=UPI002FD3E405
MVAVVSTMTTVGPNTTLQVSGVIPTTAQYISVSLGDNWDNLSFYMQVRFEKKEVAINSREGGQWGEEITGVNPFNRGEPFEVSVIFTGSDYIASFGGQEVNLPNRRGKTETPQISVTDHLQLTGFTVVKSSN